MRRTLGVVFDELLNNTISYAYDDEEEHEIEITIILSTDLLHVTISDDGRPFNPFESRAPNTELSVEDRPIGGLGIYIVQSFMDQVSYERRGLNNVLLLEKRLET